METNDTFRRLGLNSPTVHAQILKALKNPPGLVAHLADLDPHPQYLLKADLVIDGGDFGDTYIPTTLDFDGGTF